MPEARPRRTGHFLKWSTIAPTAQSNSAIIILWEDGASVAACKQKGGQTRDRKEGYVQRRVPLWYYPELSITAFWMLPCKLISHAELDKDQVCFLWSSHLLTNRTARHAGKDTKCGRGEVRMFQCLFWCFQGLRLVDRRSHISPILCGGEKADPVVSLLGPRSCQSWNPPSLPFISSSLPLGLHSYFLWEF